MDELFQVFPSFAAAEAGDGCRLILITPNWSHCDTAFVGFYVPVPEEFTNFSISSGPTHNPLENENKGGSWPLPNHSSLLPNCETSIFFFLMLENVFKNSFQFKLSGGNRKQKGRILLFAKWSGKQHHIAGHWLSIPYFNRFICSHITLVRLKQLFNDLFSLKDLTDILPVFLITL